MSPAKALATAMLLPPSLLSPQVTTEPSVRKAAKAVLVEKICVTSIAPAKSLATKEL